MAAYTKQVLVCTGREDWKSRIEDEGEHGEFVRQLRALLSRGGKFCDPYNNIMLTNSSFPPANPSTSVTSAYLLPSFRYIPSLPNSKTSIENFVKGFLQPAQLHNAHNVLPQELKEALTKDPSLQTQFLGVRDVDDILVLICGHGGRDHRCGVMGPLLRSEFEEKLQMKGIHVTTSSSSQDVNENSVHSAQVGLISHIGGHKYAGNIIIYIPPSFKGNPLAGQGIWYGRVSPEHVEGIIQETILGGKVISSMFRGGIKQDGEIIRL
ncbi:sucrose cleavage family protein [Cenococcum geophilum 1.58]|uniref:sucrose cleavage family protein n=1 Tax=Cenococcum geophilum 1.58 TaxID=794803 RepID=UPI00358F9834|nr:sucrose cleavage family protein [Cenococcum geophilum 1.58]